MTDLAKLIDIVNVKLAGVEPAGYSAAEMQRWRQDGEVIVQLLRDDHGARIRLDRDPATMSMGGVKTSATGGWSALLKNWINAARRTMDTRP